MSTRSVIARPDGDAFIGRYCHWDGYPTARGHEIWETYRELGSPAAVREYAIREGQSGYWSSYGPPSEQRAEWVAESSDNMVRSDGPDMGTEWAYIVADHALVVLERRFGHNLSDDQGHGTGIFGMGASDTTAGGHWLIKATCRWDAGEPDWEAIESGS